MTKAAKFEKFHSANPHVYDVLVRLAREWRSRTGRRRVGIDSLFGRARWEVSMSTKDPDYKIPNDHKPFYARLIMAQESDLEGLFELRRAAADRWMAEKEPHLT